MISYKKCNKSYAKLFLVKFTVFDRRVKGFKKWEFEGDEKFLFFSLYESFQCHINRFSLSLTVFEAKGVKVGEWGWNSISNNVKKIDFILFWWDFLQIIFMKNFTIVTPFLRIKRVQMVTYAVILLCLAFYCV